MKRFTLSILILYLFINILQPKHLMVEVSDHEDDEGLEEQLEDSDKIEKLEGNS